MNKKNISLKKKIFLLLMIGVIILIVILCAYLLMSKLAENNITYKSFPAAEPPNIKPNDREQIDYQLQKHQLYDDWKCVNNNSTDAIPCDENDLEYTGEEGEWIKFVDTDISNFKKIFPSLASGVVMKDARTGLFWSDTVGQAANNLDYCKKFELDADGDGNDETGWRLPTHNELIQAYINGSANNLPNPYTFWSSSIFKRPPMKYYNINGMDDNSFVWFANLFNGASNLANKNSKLYIRCVHE
ncbi:MAG: DUF1566 domain-containing protein [Candidatus Falkowbacteria bacterium]